MCLQRASRNLVKRNATKKLRGRHAKKEEDQNAEQTRNLTPGPDLDLDLGSEENIAQTQTE